jgi:subtilisin family serine protease
MKNLRTRVAGLLASTLLAATVPAALPAAAEQSADGVIVVLREGASTDFVARQHASRYGFSVQHVYHSALNGYATRMDPAVAEKLRAEPDVDYVSPDFHIQAPWKPSDSIVSSPIGPGLTILQTAPYGVRRVGASTDNHTQTLAHTGSGIGVAVIDTGIQLNHPDLSGVQNGKNCVNPALTADDDAGHGTHVAGTLAARDNFQGVVGVAPGATLHAVKVLNSAGSGTWSQVICGIDWVTANAAAKGIRVANMSLGAGGFSVTPSNSNCTNGNSDALHTAICNSVKAGITYVAAAGNSGTDAASFVPAAYSEVIAVSAWSDTNGKSDATGATYTCSGWGLQTDETWATGTNYGSVVDIAAPGVGIYSTMKGSTYGKMCGTSMAAPHVSGAAALALQKTPALTPSGVRLELRSLASALPNSVQHVENLLNVSTY